MKRPFGESPPPVAPWEWAAVALVTLAGAFLRLWQIDRLPPGLWYDEAIIGIGVLQILREGVTPIFFMLYGHPEEPLIYYLNAIGVALLGPNGTALRATSGVIGTATIPVVWWAARQFFGPRVAFFTLVFFATMRWHVHFSRLSFRTLLAPLFCAATAGFLVAALREGKWRDWILTGVFLGGGLYTYLSMRLWVVIVAMGGVYALGLVWWLRRQDCRRSEAISGAAAREGAALPAATQLLRGGTVAAAVAFLVFLPLGINYIQNPQHFTGRQEEVLDQMTAGRLLIQARDVALMGIARGDHVAKHNIPGPPKFVQSYLWPTAPLDSAAEWQDAARMGEDLPDVHGTGRPVFDVLTGLLFYAGVVLLIVQAVRGSWPAGFLLIWFVAGSLASVLSFGAPNMLRLLYLTPAAAITLGVALAALADWLRMKQPRILPAAVCAAFLVWFAAGETWRYYSEYPRHPQVWAEFNSGFAEAARSLRESDRLPETVVVPAFIADHPTFLFEATAIEDHIVRDADADGSEISGVWWALETLPPMPPLRIAAGENAVVIEDFRDGGGRVWARLVEVAAGPAE